VNVPSPLAGIAPVLLLPSAVPFAATGIAPFHVAEEGEEDALQVVALVILHVMVALFPGSTADVLRVKVMAGRFGAERSVSVGGGAEISEESMVTKLSWGL
jgi:hypothetical protein